MSLHRLPLLFSLVLVMSGVVAAQPPAARWPARTTYHQATVDGHQLFYRQAGDPNLPTIVLLHGYPSSSHTYRNLIPLLSGYFHVIAPDNLGSGYSDQPSIDEVDYSFDLLAQLNERLLDQLNIDHCVYYMQDFGAPVGFRMMRRRPDRVLGLIAQNANAYLDGIPPKKQAFFRAAQEDQSAENIARLFAFTSPDAVQHKQYLRDVSGREEIMSPDAWHHDRSRLQSTRQRLIQVRLFQDYKTNLDRYPQWQTFLRKQQPPTLLVWGQHDPVFTAAGARAYLRDVPDAQMHLLDAGHFAAEERPVEIAQRVIPFVQTLAP